MTLFLSTFVNKIDKKGRVSVPASFRTALSDEIFQGIVVFRSHRLPALECCAFRRMEQLSASVDALDLFSETQDDLASVIFADAIQIPIDGDGRVVLPKNLIDFLGVDETVAFVGRGATFQIWHPDIFAAHQEQARGRLRDGGQVLTLKANKGGEAS